jgi:hypothetical protein
MRYRKRIPEFVARQRLNFGAFAFTALLLREKRDEPRDNGIVEVFETALGAVPITEHTQVEGMQEVFAH